MASYRLLRSNKESGPYSLDDLVSMGLKPYDLVWVQGKSAAWRYPGEVEELKPYATIVEEQPYDRFYKKNTQPVKEEPVTIPEKSYQHTIVEEKPVAEEKYAKYIPKKSVFVTMPGNQSAVASKQLAAGNQQPEVAYAKAAEPTITVTENPVAAQIKYSQPLDEIKEMYVKTLQDRKSKMARRSFLIAGLKKAAVIAGLILTGVLTGYLIKSGSSKKDVLASQLLQQPVKAQTTTVPESPVQQSAINNNVITPDRQVPVNNQPAKPPVTVTEKPVVVTEKNSIPPAIKQRLLQEEKRQYAEGKLKKEPVAIMPVIKDRAEETPVKSIASDPVTGERTKQVRNGSVTNSSSVPDNSNEVRPISKAKKNGLGNLVAVTSNDYKKVAFGGIRNLELTVTNDSRYILDRVTVELQYLKPNEMPLRTETIQFHTISPNGSSTIKIPDTNRGIKVLYKIVDIQSVQSETASSGF